MASIEQVIAKIRRPPSLPNWVRLNHRRHDETLRSITRFALGRPRMALAKVYEIVAAYATLGIDKRTAFKSLATISDPAVRALGDEILSTLLPWIDDEGFAGIQVFHDMVASFPIGRGVVVPVKPTFVMLRDGKLEPVFVIGWTNIPFSPYQRRLLATIIHEAILTQEGFEGSDATVIFVPRVGSKIRERYVRAWKVSEQYLLEDHELRAQFDTFGNALDDAVPVILEEMARRGDI